MRLRELRKNAGLSQKEFAKIFGAAQNTVSQWETGTRSIDDKTLCELAAYFGVSVDYLLGLSDEKSLAGKTSEAKRSCVASRAISATSAVERGKTTASGRSW